VRCGSFMANDRGCSHTVKTYLTLQLGMSDGFAAALTLIITRPRSPRAKNVYFNSGRVHDVVIRNHYQKPSCSLSSP
jgi:hypothetical protein